jgi:3-phenylpropionate/trans-cinnamate dioxygenase ferredoxin subunit
VSDEPAQYVGVVDAVEIAPGTLRHFEVAGHKLLICRAAEEFFAVENKCSHTGALLTRGRIRGDCIVCPVRFRLRDGKHLTPPASSGLRTFAARVVEPGGGPDPNALRF